MQFAGLLDGCLAAIVDVVLVLDDLGTDETALKVGVDDTGTLRSLAAAAVGPCAHLLGACGEEGLEVEQSIGRLDDAVHTALLQADLGQEHLTLFIILQFGNLALGLGCYNQDLRILVLDSLTHCVHIGITGHGTLVVHVADVEYRLVGQQEQLMGNFLLVLIDQLHGAGTAALLQGVLVAFQHLILRLGLAVATGLGLLLDAVDAALDGFQVTQLQFQVDDFLVAHGVDGAVHVGHVVVIKASQHVDDGVGLADVAQELVAQALAAAGALDQAGDVDNLDRGGHDARGIHQFGEFVQSLIGHGDDAHVGLDGAERKVGRLRLGIRQAVEQGGFAHVGQPHDSTL